MGSSSSKVARGAARKYPTRAPGSAVTSAPAGRGHAQPEPQMQTQTQTQTQTRPQESAKRPAGDGSKDDAIRADAADPDFAPGGFSQRLHQMGIAQPNPTFSPSSTASPEHGPAAPMGPVFPSARNNATLTVLDARQRLQRQADAEFENMSSRGRRFLDMRTVVDAVKLRQHGVPQKDIEARLRIQPGLLDKIAREDILSHVSSPN